VTAGELVSNVLFYNGFCWKHRSDRAP